MSDVSLLFIVNIIIMCKSRIIICMPLYTHSGICPIHNYKRSLTRTFSPVAALEQPVGKLPGAPEERIVPELGRSQCALREHSRDRGFPEAVPAGPTGGARHGARLLQVRSALRV